MIGQLNHDREKHDKRVEKPIFSPAPARLLLKPEWVSRILWMPVDGLGDLVMSMPSLHNLMSSFPKAQVDVLAREAYVSFYHNLPFVREVISFEPPGLPERTRRSASKQDVFKLVLELRRRKYDLAVDVGGKDLYRQIALFSGARYRVGPARSHFDPKHKKNWAFAMTHPISMGTEKRHTVENALHLMRHIGVDTKSVTFFQAKDTDVCRMEVTKKLDRIGIKENFAVIHAASAVAEKQWLPSRFAAVADHLIQHYGFDVILTGIDKDIAYNEEITRYAENKDQIFNEAGEFSLSELPWLYEKANLMVTIDTGPMHIAAAVGVPIVSLFLPGSVHLYHPYNQPEGVIVPGKERFANLFSQKHISPILAQEAGHTARWMEMITVEEVVEAIANRLPHQHIVSDIVSALSV